MDLQQMAHKHRLELFKAIAHAGGGHFGGSLSLVEILTVLYFGVMRVDPKNPHWDGRDRMVLSKGHGGPALYVMLAEKGFFPKEWLEELDKSGGKLPKHVDLGVPGTDISSGSLGQGLSVATGMALASRLDGSDRRIYVVLGDGECDEGQVWEAAMAAAKYGVDNLTAILDRNDVQVDGTTAEIMPTEPMEPRWAAFGWEVLSVDGHSAAALLEAIEKAGTIKGRPTMIVAHTVKGKGISFMEGQAAWHSGSVTEAQYAQALQELEGRIHA